MRSNHFRRIFDLSLAEIDLHFGQALFAASIASFVSSLPHLGTVPISLRVAGLLTEITSPEIEVVHSPFI